MFLPARCRLALGLASVHPTGLASPARTLTECVCGLPGARTPLPPGRVPPPRPQRTLLLWGLLQHHVWPFLSSTRGARGAGPAHLCPQSLASAGERGPSRRGPPLPKFSHAGGENAVCSNLRGDRLASPGKVKTMESHRFPIQRNKVTRQRDRQTVCQGPGASCPSGWVISLSGEPCLLSAAYAQRRAHPDQQRPLPPKSGPSHGGAQSRLVSSWGRAVAPHSCVRGETAAWKPPPDQPAHGPGGGDRTACAPAVCESEAGARHALPPGLAPSLGGWLPPWPVKSHPPAKAQPQSSGLQTPRWDGLPAPRPQKVCLYFTPGT